MLTIKTVHHKMTAQYSDLLLQWLLKTYIKTKHLATMDEKVFVVPFGWCGNFPQSTSGMDFDIVQVLLD